MDLKTALNRLVWRFQDFDYIRVNKNDIDAINQVVEYINEVGEESLRSNKGFVNLYTYTLGNLLEKYNTTIDQPLVHKELHRIINTPFSYLLTTIVENMNYRQRERLLQASGCTSLKHPLQIDKEEKEIILDNLKELLNHANNKEIFYKGAWGLKEVERGLKNQIKNFLNGV